MGLQESIDRRCRPFRCKILATFVSFSIDFIDFPRVLGFILAPLGCVRLGRRCPGVTTSTGSEGFSHIQETSRLLRVKRVFTSHRGQYQSFSGIAVAKA
jgi:hypothetical protein